ncbi:MAG: protein phosphatase 2C family protein, partial [Bdellovibrionales bacterium]|nr:protein phosphatase 2C family protein [Bdellovibrionales bacterium]
MPGPSEHPKGAEQPEDFELTPPKEYGKDYEGDAGGETTIEYSAGDPQDFATNSAKTSVRWMNHDNNLMLLPSGPDVHHYQADTSYGSAVIFSQSASVSTKRVNQDALGFREVATTDRINRLRIVLADGVGGGAAGDHASSGMVKGVLDRVGSEQPLASDIQEAAESLKFSTEKIGTIERRYFNDYGAGTTIAAVEISAPNNFTCCVAGDSEVALIRDGALIFHSSPHNHLSDIYREITATAAANGTQDIDELVRHEVLTRYGNRDKRTVVAVLSGASITRGIKFSAETDPEVEIETFSNICYQSGDLLVICTDGFLPSAKVNPDDLSWDLSTRRTMQDIAKE